MSMVISWVTSLSFLPKHDRATLTESLIGTSESVEKYRLIHFMLTDPDIGLLRYASDIERIKEWVPRLLTLQQRCMAGEKVTQEEWAPVYCNLQTAARVALNKVQDVNSRAGKVKYDYKDRALADRTACVTDALENAAYHSYGMQNPDIVRSIFEAMVKAEGCEARRTRVMPEKEAVKHARELFQRKIFEFLTTTAANAQSEEQAA